jgi:hypothetical protein
MLTTTIVSVAAATLSAVAMALQALDKQPWVQKNKTLKTWIDDANDIAGQLKLIVPMGSSLSDVTTLAENKAAALVEKYPGLVSQGEVVTQVLGEFARIVSSGHVLPPSVQPAMSEVQELTTAVKALLAAQVAKVPTPVPAPAAVVLPKP